MLLSLPDLAVKYQTKITGILHVGAHTAEEAPIYNQLGIKNVVWVEANPENKMQLLDALAPYDHQLIFALITDEDHGNREFHVTNYDSMSSSVFEFGTHPTFSPDTVFTHSLKLETRTLDSLAEEYDFSGINMLNMDIQGAELLALQGARNLLPSIEYLYCEINRDEVYKGCAKVWEVEDFLYDFNYKLVETSWVGDQGWGDGLFVKISLL